MQMSVSFYEEIGKETEQCMKCGFCAFVCPVYQEERIESGCARGKNEMVKALLSRELEFDRDLVDRLYKCTACMACTESCPTRTPVPRIIVAARAEAARVMGVRFPYGFAYRHFLSNRRFLGYLLGAARHFQSAFMPESNGTIRHLPSFLPGLLKGRRVPAIAPRFLNKMVARVNKPARDSKPLMRIGYFSGCMHQFALPHIGKKAIDLLTRLGIEVIMPAEQGCCGAAAFLGVGDLDSGRRCADANVAAFKDMDYIVTACATCSCTLKEYQRFLSDTPERQESYSSFAGKIKHISQFLTDILELPSSSFEPADEIRGKRLTWHDPCHLSRHLGIKEQPRRILKSVTDGDYVEMPNASRCCGMAGQFNLMYYELSQKIAEKKLESIEASEADIVVTACPGCHFQLTDSIARRNKLQKVMSLMEVLK